MSSPDSRNALADSTNAPARRNVNENSPSRSPAAIAVPTTAGQGLARTPSLRQSRPARKTPSRMSSSFGPGDDGAEDEAARAANTQLIADLKEHVHRAEQASEQYRKQLDVLQQRLDEAATEQTSAEERYYQLQTEVDRLRADIKESSRQRREVEVAYEEDKQTFLQEHERQATKEAELHAVIARLNETLRARGAERATAPRATGAVQGTDPEDETAVDVEKDHAHAPPDVHQTLRQKESTIEALRFDLAEAQLRLAEQEHMDDGRLQSLETAVMEIKMQNARLVEENESFQMLLSERTLKGTFLPDHHAHDDVGGMATLAEELESTEDETTSPVDGQRRLENEVKSLREENKALTLYVDKIIGRLLRHEGFEHIILGKDEPPEPPSKIGPHEKALPAVPDQQSATANAANVAAGVASGLLQRARSVVSRPGPKPRPMSYAPAAMTPPTANENPETAPSIPLNRGHRRVRSDQAQTDLAAAAVVQQMNRGSPMRTASGGPMSPGIQSLSPHLAPNRQSYFGPPSSTPRASSGSGPRGGSSANSVTSEHSEEQRSNTDGSSTAAMTGGPGSGAGPSGIPGAVMKQNQLRPLRLVQEQSAIDDEAQKRANRGSWMGWLKRSTIESQNE